MLKGIEMLNKVRAIFKEQDRWSTETHDKTHAKERAVKDPAIIFNGGFCIYT